MFFEACISIHIYTLTCMCERRVCIGFLDLGNIAVVRMIDPLEGPEKEAGTLFEAERGHAGEYYRP